MRLSRSFWLAISLVIVIAGVLFWTISHRSPSGLSDASTDPGGHLVATTRADPKTLNRLISPQAPEGLLSLLTNATLVRLDRVTGSLEPRLAESWSLAPNQRTWTIKLRTGVEFSDGQPFTSADVLFTLRALYDEQVSSPLASSFLIEGRPIVARADGADSVTLEFPGPYGPGLSIFDSLPILPAHKLSAALEAGTFATAWTVKTPITEIAGLGPFMLAEYVAGQHIRLVRNPHFWRKDAHGRTLPYLDQIDIQIVPDRDAEVLRLEAGNLDLPKDFARPEDLTTLKQQESSGRLRLVEAGVDINPDNLWFPLAAGAPHARDRPWLQKEELRKAISYAVDRQKIVDTVYLGAGVPIYGPVTPGNKEWYVADLPRTEHDVARARSLLNSIGLIDRDHDGQLEDPAGKPARFSIVTQKGDTIRERTLAVIQDELREVGLGVDVLAVERNSIPMIWQKADYDAIYFNTQSDAFDPARNLDFWLSSGSFHFWNPLQKKPATEWEMKIDELMVKQSTSIDPAERHRMFAEVQRLFAEHQPTLYFAATKAVVAMNARVNGATPAVIQPPVLWNAEVLSVRAPDRR